MLSSFTHRLHWHARQYAADFGLPGLAALMLVVGCVLFALRVLQPLQGRLDDVQRHLETRPPVKAALLAAAADPARQLATFRAFFPPQDGLPDAMAKIYDAAAQYHLSLDQGDYQLTRDRTLQLTRYDITLPVKGDYVQIRKFVALSLSVVPSLALDGISFTRPSADAASVDAQLHFTLYLGAD
jgi:hypothetical protein